MTAVANLTRLAAAVAWHAGLDPDTAADVAQDTWERYLRQDGIDEPEAWFAVAARNRARSLLRRQAVADRYMPALVPPQPSDPEVIVLEAISRREQLAALRAAIQQLPRGERAVMTRRACGQPVASIAADLGMAQGTVQSYCGRAFRRIRAELEDTWTR